ncbi:Slc8a3 [Symbiodinium sp. CCMP2456]|nr:Slc8a3 [Symbiodinium sp. CCMP2456]
MEQPVQDNERDRPGLGVVHHKCPGTPGTGRPALSNDLLNRLAGLLITAGSHCTVVRKRSDPCPALECGFAMSDGAMLASLRCSVRGTPKTLGFVLSPPSCMTGLVMFDCLRRTYLQEPLSLELSLSEAELQHLGEQFLAQAQTLAEQGEARRGQSFQRPTAHNLALVVREPAADLTNGSREELVHRFVREAKQLEPPGGVRLLVADVAQVLRAWQARLKRTERADSDTPGRAAGRASEALQALLQSQALHIALTALTRSRAGRAVLRAAAEAEAEGSASRPMLEGEAGVCLKEILACACAVPAPLVKQLLVLLSDAADEKSQAKKPGTEAVMDSATQDLQWILALLSASLLHSEEVAADDAGELRRSLDVVGSASAASAELPPLNSEAHEGAET